MIQCRETLSRANRVEIDTHRYRRFFKSFGWTELDVGGPGIVVADVAAQYRSEAFHGETLLIEFAVNDYSTYGCDMVWRVSDKASSREIARGKHGIVFFDYVSRSKAEGVTTGISAADRARTIQVAVARNAVADDIVQPGQIHVPVCSLPKRDVRPGYIDHQLR